MDLSTVERAEQEDFWRELNPGLTISGDPFAGMADAPPLSEEEKAACRRLIREEGYLQTEPRLPPELLAALHQGLERVVQAGFPPLFALVYDEIYWAFSYFDPVIRALLGDGYRLLPNFWVFYIAPGAVGARPHRDTEYPGAVDAEGVPTVLTLWIAITEATPLNSCLYVLPADRDPLYAEGVFSRHVGAGRFAIENARALPAAPGTLTCWGQPLYHWSGNSSPRARVPRVSVGATCQRGDIPDVDNASLGSQPRLDFSRRLSLIARGLRHVFESPTCKDDPHEALREFVHRHQELGEWAPLS